MNASVSTVPGLRTPPPRFGAVPLDVALRRLRLLVTRTLDGMLHGDYLGFLPGTGSEPGESRAYRAGDDVRHIDWPVTARTTVPHVRQTVADRELSCWLAVDLSASLDFGTGHCEKRDLALAAAAAVGYLVARGGNRIGAVASNGATVVRWPAQSGRASAHGMLRRLALTPRARPSVHSDLGSDLGATLAMLLRPPRRRGQIVVISDFLTADTWSRPLRALAARHEVLAIEIVDPRELTLPNVGVLPVQDPETGSVHEVQTADPAVREAYAAGAAAQRAEIARRLRTAGATQLQLRTDRDWLADIVRFVTQRRRRGVR